MTITIEPLVLIALAMLVADRKLGKRLRRLLGAIRSFLNLG
jgi:hypothetical protein